MATAIIECKCNGGFKHYCLDCGILMSKEECLDNEGLCDCCKLDRKGKK